MTFVAANPRRASLSPPRTSSVGDSKVKDTPKKTHRRTKKIRFSASKELHTKRRRRAPTTCAECARRSSAASSTSTTLDFTVLDLIRNIDEKSRRLRNADIVKYTNPRLLRLSERWSTAKADTDPSDLVDLDLDGNDDDDENVAVSSSLSSSSSRAVGYTCALSSECASLEVEAIALLASIEHRRVDDDGNRRGLCWNVADDDERRRARIQRLLDDMDDDEIERELSHLAAAEEDARRETTLAVHGLCS